MINEMVRKFANELRIKVFEFAKDRKEGRTGTSAMMQALEPLINEIAKLRIDMDFTSVCGYEKWDSSPVPGEGAILSCVVFDGIVYATRKNGGLIVEWKATYNGWEKVSNVEVRGRPLLGDPS